MKSGWVQELGVTIDERIRFPGNLKIGCCFFDLSENKRMMIRRMIAEKGGNL